MQQNINNSNNSVSSSKSLPSSTTSSSELIDLAKLWGAIWQHKFFIIIFSMIFSIISIAFALTKPDIYKASILVTPTSQESRDSSLSSLSGQLGSVANLAGINLSGDSNSKVTLALEIIQTRYFIEKFIKTHNISIALIAGKGWDSVNNTLIINEKLYSPKEKKWLIKRQDGNQTPPTPWEEYNAFTKLLNISQNKSSPTITIELSFFSPYTAQQWLTWLVNDVNEYMRTQDQTEAQDSINYLMQQIDKTKVSSMEIMFYKLIEEQTKKIMLTEVQKEYILKTIDPAHVPDKKDSPNRALIVILGTFLGGIFSVFIILIHSFRKKSVDN